MLGFTKADIQLQEDIVDCFVKHPKRRSLLQLEPDQLINGKETRQINVAESRSTVSSSPAKKQLSPMRRLSKKCTDRAVSVKRRSHGKILQLKLRQKTTKSPGTIHLVDLVQLVLIQLLEFVIIQLPFCSRFVLLCKCPQKIILKGCSPSEVRFPVKCDEKYATFCFCYYLFLFL